jgi:hypothetical protein
VEFAPFLHFSSITTARVSVVLKFVELEITTIMSASLSLACFEASRDRREVV